MTAFYPITPMKAVEFVEAGGVPNAKRVIADYAAADLVKSYAQAIETIEVGGAANCVRGATLSPELWQRIVREGGVDDVWTGGTVRLAASELIGGAPEVRITGIGFSKKYLQRVVDHHRGHPKPALVKTAAARTWSTVQRQEIVDPTPPERKVPNPAAIPPGALLATVTQAQDALGASKTTIYKLMGEGRLERAKDVAGTRITVVSIHAYAGVAA